MPYKAEARYIQNDLQPWPLDKDSLRDAHTILTEAIGQRLTRLGNSDRSSSSAPYTGLSGITAVYLRLSLERPALSSVLNVPSRYELLSELALSVLPDLRDEAIQRTWVSPIGSASCGRAVLELIRQLQLSEISARRWNVALRTLAAHIQLAIDARRDPEVQAGGGAEVLYGRAGLLWAALNISYLADNSEIPEERVAELRRVVNDDIVRVLSAILVHSGKRGKELFEASHGSAPCPLMWQWHGKFYLGAIHGSVGILSVLLQVPAHLLSPNSLILVHTSALALLSRVCTTWNGSLPSSLPARQRDGGDLVQLCHGAPGVLLLAATLRSLHPALLAERANARVVQRAERMAADKVWREGLLKKGLGVCHGVSGNAYPLLLLSTCSPSLSDLHLSRALAFLVHSTELPPLQRSHTYHTPDNPDSLFEGLAGAVCAWVDACAVIEARLDETSVGALGVPGMGGLGVKGVF